MPDSIWESSIEKVFREARAPKKIAVTVGAQEVEVTRPFPSPADWRDHWVYFLLVDRFNHPDRPPRHLPYDAPRGTFQGGNFAGIRARLDYLKQLGAGAIWLSPVIKNCQYEETTYHGYGFQDFLQIDPRFASDPAAARADPALVEEELCRLIDEAHARNLYIIFDVVLNHAGNVFQYEGFGHTAPFRSHSYPIRWHDHQGRPWFADFAEVEGALPPDAAVWPVELQKNAYFRRQGKGGEAAGDFESLKELVTDAVESSPFGATFPVRKTLIRAYQYLIAKFDVDGFRIDTLKYIEPEFARIFGNAMREFALSIGKKNFFTFGEVFDEEERIARFIGRNAAEPGQPIGVDAALDFPLFFRLPAVAKGFLAPSVLVDLYRRRKSLQKGIVTSHGEASGHFLTFLDNHDMRERFYYQDPQNPARFDDQVKLALSCLFCLPGIPCIYYGTEQGLEGRGGSDQFVREALWGKPNSFAQDHPFYLTLNQLSAIRSQEPAFRFGRLYFRPISGNGRQFGISHFRPGVIAFSRILNEREVVVVANPDAARGFMGEVIVDASLHPQDSPFEIMYSNQPGAQQPGGVTTREAGSIEIEEPDGSFTHGPARTVPVALRPMESQILRRADWNQ